MFTHIDLIWRVFVCLSGVGGWGFALRALWPVLEPKWQRMIAMFILGEFGATLWLQLFGPTPTYGLQAK